VHGDAANIVAHHCALASMESGANGDAEWHDSSPMPYRIELSIRNLLHERPLLGAFLP
jgi:hypothetical protein